LEKAQARVKQADYELVEAKTDACVDGHAGAPDDPEVRKASEAMGKAMAQVATCERALERRAYAVNVMPWRRRRTEAC
jgi:hypothetical protein